MEECECHGDCDVEKCWISKVEGRREEYLSNKPSTHLYLKLTHKPLVPMAERKPHGKANNEPSKLLPTHLMTAIVQPSNTSRILMPALVDIIDSTAQHSTGSPGSRRTRMWTFTAGMLSG